MRYDEAITYLDGLTNLQQEQFKTFRVLSWVQGKNDYRKNTREAVVEKITDGMPLDSFILERIVNVEGAARLVAYVELIVANRHQEGEGQDAIIAALREHALYEVSHASTGRSTSAESNALDISYLRALQDLLQTLAYL